MINIITQLEYDFLLDSLIMYIKREREMQILLQNKLYVIVEFHHRTDDID